MSHIRTIYDCVTLRRIVHTLHTLHKYMYACIRTRGGQLFISVCVIVAVVVVVSAAHAVIAVVLVVVFVVVSAVAVAAAAGFLSLHYIITTSFSLKIVHLFYALFNYMTIMRFHYASFCFIGSHIKCILNEHLITHGERYA